MNIHIKRMDLFAVLTLTNDAGRRFVTTLRRDIKKDDPRVREMIRRFRQDKKVIDQTPIVKTRGTSMGKTRVGINKSKQGVLV